MAETLSDNAVPKLGPGVRLKYDENRKAWLLLAPERVIEADGPAKEILQRCDGARSVASIIDELAQIFTADRDVIADDVRDMLSDLAAKRLVRL